MGHSIRPKGVYIPPGSLVSEAALYALVRIASFTMASGVLLRVLRWCLGYQVRLDVTGRDCEDSRVAMLPP